MDDNVMIVKGPRTVEAVASLVASPELDGESGSRPSSGLQPPKPAPV